MVVCLNLDNVSDEKNPTLNENQFFRCLLWFKNERFPVLSNVSEMYTIWPEFWPFGVEDKIYGPQLATCKF